ncbi:MAG TPA: tetratricopeptide repeat protein [Opitutaceae bacterium]|nr:tetratricopeptide repeat protein [Opitutaceae bacterium]
MTTPTDPIATETALPNFEAKLHGFWQKNRNAVFAVCAVALLAVAGRGGWQLFTAQREKSIAADYVAATTPEKLHDFAHEHQGSPLAGVAHLRLADDEYAAGNYADATVDYTQASTALAGTPFAGRAQLGAAIAKIQAGRTADGEAQLKEVANDLTLLKAVRAEAAYDLASAAADEGRADDAKKFAAQVQQIDPEGPWARRAADLAAKQP